MWGEIDNTLPDSIEITSHPSGPTKPHKSKAITSSTEGKTLAGS